MRNFFKIILRNKPKLHKSFSELYSNINQKDQVFFYDGLLEDEIYMQNMGFIMKILKKLK